MTKLSELPNIDLSDLYFEFHLPATTPLIDILTNEIRFCQLRVQNREFAKYLSLNVQQLLEYALLDLSGDIGKKAFILLTTNGEMLTDATIQDGKLIDIAIPIIKNDVVPPLSASRVAVLLSHALQRPFEPSKDIAELINLLFKFIDESAVFDLFHILCDRDNNTTNIHEKIHRLMIEADFKHVVINELNDLNNHDKVINTLSIIKDCLKNTTFEEFFLDDETLETIERTIQKIENDDSYNLEIYNNIWRVISAYCHQETSDKLTNLFEKAQSIMMKPFEELHTYHTYITDFFTKIFLFSPSLFDETTKNYTCEIIIKMLVQFPNASNLMGSIFRLIRITFKDEEFESVVLFQLMSYIIILARQEERNAASANALAFLREAETNKKSDKLLNEYLVKSETYQNFYNSFFKIYLRTVDKPYGGKIIFKV